MANLLIFDADYVSELTAKMQQACDLMAKAVSSLKSAQNHDNWQCKERGIIIDNFDELNRRLDSLNTGVNETTRILGASVSRFAALEQQYESQAESLSDEITSNYGFSASVSTGGSPASAGSFSAADTGQVPAGGTPETPGAAGAAGAAAGAAGAAGHSRGLGAGGAGARAVAGMAGRFAGMGGQNPSGPVIGGGTAGMTMNVNLPVTYIPDHPGAAAKGIKDTREIAQIAVSSVAVAVTEVLYTGAGGTFTGARASSVSQMNFTAAAPSLAEAYNAGKSIFENSAAIMASPAQPHTTERLAMAAGLVGLASSTAAGLAVLGQTAAATAAGVAGSAGAAASEGQGVFRASASISQNAGSLRTALQGNSDAEEFSSLLGILEGDTSSTGSAFASSSSSGNNNGSFFDMIVSYLREKISGGASSSRSTGNTFQSLFSASSSSSASASASGTTSPVIEFLGNFVMDQAV
ncbi:MAG: hypothetical protein IJS39_02865 [Synergistaceae bacterium]|nr:hypothetical protein [Synergistaceae bacterium]